MAITRVGTATGTTTCTVPTHAVGDLIIIAAFRSGSASAPSLPSGYTSILAKAGTTCAMQVGYKIATSTSDASGTWTNATELVCHVYRPSSGNGIGVGGSASTSGTTNTLNFPAEALLITGGSSWVAGFIGTSSTTQTISTAPSGMTNESSVTGTAQAAGHDTNGGVTSWASTNVTATGTAGNWVSAVVEIVDNTPGAWSVVPVVGAVTYSNSDKTGVAGATTPSCCVSQTSHPTSAGKFYFEVTSVAGIADGSLAVGVCDSTHANYAGLSDNGNWHDSAVGGLATFTTFKAGDTIGVAVDLANNLAWFKNITQGGQWNQSSNANPSTNTGGSSYTSGLFTTAYAFMYSSTTTEGLTLNTGTSAFAGSLPTGFTAWYATAATYTETLTIAAASTLTAIKQAGKALSISSVSSLSLLKAISKALAIASVSTLTARKSVGRLLPISSASALTALKSSARTLTVSSVSMLTAVAGNLRRVSLSIATASALMLSKSVGRALPISEVSTLSLVKQAGRSLAISSTSALTASAIKAHLLTLAISCASTLTKAVSVGKQLTIGCVSAVASLKTVIRALSMSTVSLLAAIKDASRALVIASTSMVSAVAMKFRLILLTIAATSTVTTSRATGKRLLVAVVSALSTGRIITKLIAVATTSNLSAAASIVRLVFVGIGAATSTSLSKAVAKILPIRSVSVLTLARLFAKTIIVSCVSSVTTIVFALVAQIGAFARQIIGRATMLQIAGSPMTTVHDPVEFICGDNWQITGPLQDAYGNPLNLTGATIVWKLDTVDSLANLITLDNGANGGVSVVTLTTATILVNVPAQKTGALQAGMYRDYLRVVLSDGTPLTEWTGIIKADARPA
jgi:hypothetical protein